MGDKDTVIGEYMRGNDRFADAFNFYIYGGRQVIDPESLVEMDTREIAVPYGGSENAEQPVQKIRDIIKSVTAMTDRKTAYLILAVENQSNIHYAMVVRNMLYDALQYTAQVQKAAASHKKSGDYRGVDRDEYLSGFMKNDKLIPVITLVILFSPKPWDGDMSLHEMFVKQDEEVLALVPDYRLNVIAPAMIDDTEFEKFQSGLRQILEFIKYANDENRLAEIMNIDEAFRHLGRSEVNVLNACVNAKLDMNSEMEEMDVCVAIENMKKAAAVQAANQERVITRLSDVKNLMKNMKLSVEQAMDVLELSEDDKKSLILHLQ